MVAKSLERECLHCRELFLPNPRNRWHQKFCTKPGCRHASKVESQRRWLSQPANRDHFRGSANVERVRQWRKAHPGYWKRAKKSPRTLQDIFPSQATDVKQLATKTSLTPLQDFLAAQDPLMVGLISHLIDSPLQDRVEQATLRLLTKGQTILDLRSGVKINKHHYEDQKTNPLPGAAAPYSGSVQLGRSTAGP